MSKCKKGYVMNPMNTGRCIKIDGPTFKKLSEDKKKEALLGIAPKVPLSKSPIKKKKWQKKSTSPPKKRCPKGKIFNPSSNRCVNIDGAVGKRLIANKQSKPRAEGVKFSKNGYCVDNGNEKLPTSKGFTELMPKSFNEKKQQLFNNCLPIVCRYLNFNKFYIEHIIGAGGFGIVWKVSHIKNVTPKSVAWKTMYSSVRNLKIKEEIDIMLSLHNPYIIKVYDGFFEHNYNVVKGLLILEYGFMDLLKYIRSKNDKDRYIIAKNVASSMLKALEYLKNMKIIHRDIKLQNIIITKSLDNPTYKLADFGLAIRVPDTGFITSPGIAGTPDYMSPEMLGRQLPYSYPVDVWALGIVIYAVVVYEFPFGKSDVRQENILKYNNQSINSILNIKKVNELKITSKQRKDFDVFISHTLTEWHVRWTPDKLLQLPFCK